LKVVGHLAQVSPFCPNIAVTPDGDQVWMTLKDTGKVMVFDGHPPFTVLTTIDTGPITNHVNFIRRNDRTLAYVTVGGLNQVKVFSTSDYSLLKTIPVGDMPHGIWPSGDGSRVYVGLENDDEVIAIDTDSNSIIAHIEVGQAPQALVYVPNAVPAGAGKEGLKPLGIAGEDSELKMYALGASGPEKTNPAPTSVSLFDQGLVQVLQAAVTGLDPGHVYMLGLADYPDGSGSWEPLASFKTNQAGAAIVNAVGQIRPLVIEDKGGIKRYLVITDESEGKIHHAVQLQSD
jgi:YVTN family beta-propeller protein